MSSIYLDFRYKYQLFYNWMDQEVSKVREEGVRNIFKKCDK